MRISSESSRARRRALRAPALALVAMLSLLVAGCVTETVSKKPDQEEVVKRLITLGTGYLQQGEYVKAKDNLQRALQMNPKSTEALTTLGVAFQLEGEPELAEHHFKRALEINPKATQARNNFAGFLFEQGRYKEAEREWVAASKDSFYPLRARVYANLGLCYARQGDAAKSEASYLRAVELNASQPQALLALANVRFDQQNYDEAKFYYGRFVTVSRQTPGALWLCVRLNRVLKDRDQEASCALALKNLFPSSPEYRLLTESAS